MSKTSQLLIRWGDYKTFSPTPPHQQSKFYSLIYSKTSDTEPGAITKTAETEAGWLVRLQQAVLSKYRDQCYVVNSRQRKIPSGMVWFIPGVCDLTRAVSCFHSTILHCTSLHQPDPQATITDTKYMPRTAHY